MTISGQSNGGSQCWQLLASPLAEGLFHKAIILSGPANNAAPRADHELLGDAWLKKANIDSLEQLNRVESEETLQHTATVQNMALQSADGEYGFLSDTVKQPGHMGPSLTLILTVR